jgi:O-antigen/teichoic acid export membrane protein
MLEAIKSKTAQKVVSNTIYQAIGKFVTMTITIGITVLVTRIYGRQGYGEFNLMQSFPGIFFIIADFGFNAIATRELATNWKNADKYFANILLIRLLLSAVLFLITSLALSLFPYSETLKFGIRLSLLLIFTQALFATTNIIFQVKLRYDYSAIGLALGSVIILGFALLASRLGWGIVWVNFAYVLGGLVTFLIGLYFVKRMGVMVSLAYDKELWKYLFVQTLPIGLMFIFSQINFRSDSILLSVLSLPERLGFNNTESVALYGLPYKIFEVTLVIPTFFMNAVYPIFVRHMHASKEQLKKTFSQATLVLLFGGILVGILGYFFAPWMIAALGGSEFSESIYVLRILLAGIFLFYLTQPVSWLIVTLGKQKYLPLIYITSAVFNLSLNVWLIPKYSFYASAYLTWISEILILVLLAIFARRSWKEYYAKA